MRGEARMTRDETASACKSRVICSFKAWQLVCPRRRRRGHRLLWRVMSAWKTATDGGFSDLCMWLLRGGATTASVYDKIFLGSRLSQPYRFGTASAVWREDDRADTRSVQLPVRHDGCRRIGRDPARVDRDAHLQSRPA